MKLNPVLLYFARNCRLIGREDLEIEVTVEKYGIWLFSKVWVYSFFKTYRRVIHERIGRLS